MTVDARIVILAVSSIALFGCSSGATETELPSVSPSSTSVTSATESASPSPTEDAAIEVTPAPSGEATSEDAVAEPEVPEFDEAALDDMWEYVSDPIGLCKIWRDGDIYDQVESMGADREAADTYFTKQCAHVGDGSRAAPFNIDTPLSAGDDWSLEVTDIELDAWGIVSAENQFNDPPRDGYQFVLFTVEATYEGATEPVDLHRTFNFAVVGAGGNTYDERCGVIPSPLRDVGDMYAGATGSGNVCIVVASDQLEGASLRVDTRFGDGGVFLRLPEA